MKTDTLLCLGPSQWPLLKNGSQVTIERENRRFCAGQLVVFPRKGIQICHRLLKCRKMEGKVQWLIKGDANLNDDGWVEEGQIIGQVVSVEGKSVRHWMFRLLSGFFFVHSRLQYEFFQIIFHSRLGRKLGLLRMKYLPRPIFMSLYGKLTAPWVFLRRGA